MRRYAIVAFLFICVAALILPVKAQAATQCEFALILAQLLDLRDAAGNPAATGLDAIALLKAVEIQPLGDWACDGAMTSDIIAQVEASVAAAVAKGLIDAGLADGVVETASEQAGIEYTPPAANIGGIGEEGVDEDSPFLPQ